MDGKRPLVFGDGHRKTPVVLVKKPRSGESTFTASVSASPAAGSASAAAGKRPVEFGDGHRSTGFVLEQKTVALVRECDIKADDSDASHDEQADDEPDQFRAKEEYLRSGIADDMLLGLHLNDTMVQATVDQSSSQFVDWRHKARVIHSEKKKALAEMQDGAYESPDVHTDDGSSDEESAHEESAASEGAGAAGGDKDVKKMSKMQVRIEKPIGKIIAKVLRNLLQDPTIDLATAKNASALVTERNSLKEAADLLWAAFKRVHHFEVSDSDADSSDGGDEEEKTEDLMKILAEGRLQYWNGLSQEQILQSFRDAGYGANIVNGVLYKTTVHLQTESTGPEYTRYKPLVNTLRITPETHLSMAKSEATLERDTRFTPMTFVVDMPDAENCFRYWQVAEQKDTPDILVAVQIQCTAKVSKSDIQRLLTDYRQDATDANPYGTRKPSRPVHPPPLLSMDWSGKPTAGDKFGPQMPTAGTLFFTNNVEGVQDVLDSVPGEPNADNSSFNVSDVVRKTDAKTGTVTWTIDDSMDEDLHLWLQTVLQKKFAAKQTSTYTDEPAEKKNKKSKEANDTDEESGGEGDAVRLEKKGGRKVIKTFHRFPLLTADQSKQIGIVYGIAFKGDLKKDITNVQLVLEISPSYVKNGDSTCAIECFEWNDASSSSSSSSSSSDPSKSGSSTPRSDSDMSE